MTEPLLIHKASGELVADDPFIAVGTKLRYPGSSGIRYGIITESCVERNRLGPSDAWAVFGNSPEDSETRKTGKYPETRTTRSRVTVLTEEEWRKHKRKRDEPLEEL